MSNKDQGLPRLNVISRLIYFFVAGENYTRSPFKVLLIGVVLVGWLGLTGYGAYEASKETETWRRLLDAFYGPFTFLTPQSDYLNRSDASPLNGPMWFGRFFGAALPVLALVWIWLRLSRLAIARFLLRWAKGHVVILGRDGSADAIALRTARSGVPVVLIEDGVDNVRTRTLSSAGVLQWPMGVLSSTLKVVGLQGASAVVAWARDDALSIADAAHLGQSAQGQCRDIMVHVESAETQRALRRSPALLTREQCRLRPISLTLRAVRQALGDARLVDAAIERTQKYVHVALHGSGSALQAAAVQVLRQNWSVRLSAPHVSYLMETETDWASWRDHHATFFTHVKGAIGQDAGTLVHAVDRQVLIADNSVTRHIVDLGNDEDTLRAAFNLASELVRRHQTPPEIQLVLRNMWVAKALISTSEIDFLPTIEIAGDLSVVDWLTHVDDVEAARIHADYMSAQGASQEVKSLAWPDLPETYLHANRAAADHLAVKRSDIAAMRQPGGELEPLRSLLAKVEHDRWCIERLLDGWSPGKREKGRLLHDNLVPWDALGTEAKQLDYTQIDKILR